MRSRRSISDIVAVVLLIVIAIAAAVIIYMWLSGVIGGIHMSVSATQVKLEITGASVTRAGGSYSVTVYVYNPPGSPTVSIATAELEFTNGTLICSNPITTATVTTTTTTSNGAPTTGTTTTTALPPSAPATVTFTCNPPSGVTLRAGTPVEIVLITTEGVQVAYTATVS